MYIHQLGDLLSCLGPLILILKKRKRTRSLFTSKKCLSGTRIDNISVWYYQQKLVIPLLQFNLKAFCLGDRIFNFDFRHFFWISGFSIMKLFQNIKNIKNASNCTDSRSRNRSTESPSKDTFPLDSSGQC
jgi:hypothetical protein